LNGIALGNVGAMLRMIFAVFATVMGKAAWVALTWRLVISIKKLPFQILKCATLKPVEEQLFQLVEIAVAVTVTAQLTVTVSLLITVWRASVKTQVGAPLLRAQTAAVQEIASPLLVSVEARNVLIPTAMTAWVFAVENLN
jgi:hypothetical protein